MLKYCIITAGCLLVSGLSTAQDTLRLDFRQAVDLALASNLDYRIQENNMEVLRKEKQVALASHFPTASINTSLQRQAGQQFQQVEGEIVVTNIRNETIATGINLNMPVFNGGRRILDTQSTRLAYLAGGHALDRATQQVVFDVSQRYLQVLLDQELLRIARENLENQKQQLEQIEGFVSAGLRTLSDQYNQESEVARLESVVVDAEIQLENDLWSLAEYLQLEAGQILIPESIDSLKESLGFQGVTIDELYELAKNSRPDLKQQDLLVRSSKKNVQAMRAMLFPRLNAFYNYNTFYTSLDDRAFRTQFLDIYPQNALGLSLSIPIFSNFQTRLEVSRSRVAYQNQLLQQESVDRKVFQEVKLAHQNYSAAIKKEKNTQVQVLAAEEAQKAVQERFRLGLSNFVDLATANQQLVAAKGDQAQAIFTLYFQEVQMEYALGTLEL